MWPRKISLPVKNAALAKEKVFVQLMMICSRFTHYYVKQTSS